mmetsp:Transcript_31034/g.60529  ORF Transcript_31034/g.60529 Transcript_31034/m.60529 type:complete len:204 (-) Transcript_31034:305-916(-)
MKYCVATPQLFTRLRTSCSLTEEVSFSSVWAETAKLSSCATPEALSEPSGSSSPTKPLFEANADTNFWEVDAVSLAVNSATINSSSSSSSTGLLTELPAFASEASLTLFCKGSQRESRICELSHLRFNVFNRDSAPMSFPFKASTVQAVSSCSATSCVLRSLRRRQISSSMLARSSSSSATSALMASASSGDMELIAEPSTAR